MHCGGGGGGGGGGERGGGVVLLVWAVAAVRPPNPPTPPLPVSPSSSALLPTIIKLHAVCIWSLTSDLQDLLKSTVKKAGEPRRFDV